ncbi:YnfA family protein [Rhabdaerophilum sp. SD176]|uniref:YnfA family protein n=1 Tax=Rhabdaerophilum sp. SD176 TaxID=2983548 RepID=UPI0024DFB462|nr:YnfA family protein [Rhabdaerophilum sp. SD176]
MRIWAIYITAAFAELAGCFAFWVWLRNGRSLLWVVPGMVSLVAFAWLLTLVPTEAAGRAYAAYGGIYVVASVLWIRFVEGVAPDRWDMIGATICILGAAVILLGPRTA